MIKFLGWISFVFVGLAIGFFTWGFDFDGPIQILSQSTADDLMPLVGFALICLATVYVYFLPTLIAHSKRSEQVGVVLIINLFFGWTLIGWVVALCFAFWKGEKQRVGADRTASRAIALKEAKEYSA